MAWDIKVGDLVVCVNDSTRVPGGMFPKNEALKLGRIYTVSDIFVCDGVVSLDLQELGPRHYSIAFYQERVGYGAWRFRPVKKSALDVFRKHLVKPPKETVSA